MSLLTIQLLYDYQYVTIHILCTYWGGQVNLLTKEQVYWACLINYTFTTTIMSMSDSKSSPVCLVRLLDCMPTHPSAQMHPHYTTCMHARLHMSRLSQTAGWWWRSPTCPHVRACFPSCSSAWQLCLSTCLCTQNSSVHPQLSLPACLTEWPAAWPLTRLTAHSRDSISWLHSCDKSSYINCVYSQCHVDSLACTVQNVNNQTLTQVSQLYVHLAFCL